MVILLADHDPLEVTRCGELRRLLELLRTGIQGSTIASHRAEIGGC
jgi:hypothetical protein